MQISAAHICERPADLCKMTKERGRPLSLFTVRICETNPKIGRLPPSGFSPDSSEKLPMGWGLFGTTPLKKPLTCEGKQE